MTDAVYAERFRTALELAETGVAIMRQNLRRRHPDGPPEAIDRLLRDWLADRPPDSCGRHRPLT